MTIHGILEEKYFHGRLGPLKRAIFANAMKNVDVFHGVSTDILDHFIKAYPRAKARGSRCVVITNGIMTAPFAEPSPNAGRDLRELLKVEKDTFIFGFFGRFMPQKGFNYVIDAVECLKNADDRGKFVIMPVGSGDYEPHYRGQIEKRGLEPYFKFIPYKPDISWMMKGCDTVLMPSIWEAWGLLACEVLCAGVPLIATNCIGLREAVANTPAVVIPPHDHISLARAMQNVMHNPGLKAEFEDFRTEAAIRFDVRRSAEKLFALFAEICGRHAAAVPQPLLTPRE
jgi:glycosyltransferase involved in cell wall biosynthesis